MISDLRSLNRSSKEGAALVIVLAFVVLLAGLVVAYFSRTIADRQLAKASSDDTLADLLARSALDIVVADFKQEMANGTPISSSNVVPQHSPSQGTAPVIPNLVRRSVRSDGVSSPAIQSEASAVNSTTDPSVNGRSITLARWNSHYLVPKSNTGDDSPEPINGAPIFSAPNYWAPDWVLVTRNGPSLQPGLGSGATALSNSINTNPNYVIGRYAYAVYDEGGLLDANVVGLPSPTPGVAEIGRKGSAAFVDLTGIKMTSAGSTPNPTAVSKMVAWRNYATLQCSGTFADLSPTPNPSRFTNYFLDRTRDFRSATTTVYAGRTDQVFINRRELIELFRGNGAAGSSGIGVSFNLLQFLGTFSREVNHPTWSNSGTLLAGRFPLGRFDLFGSTPPSASDAALVQKYFGLIYVAASGLAAPEHWQYNGAMGSARQAAIPALAGTRQDPELFVLLKYALPGASDGEVLSIGASLIDQRDSDSNTTWIEFGDPALPAQKAFGVDSTPPLIPTDPRPASPPVLLKRSFRNVGELGYAYRNGSTSLDFTTSTSPDAPLLDLFTYNTAPIRAGIINVNTQNSPILSAIIKGALPSEASAAGITQAQATPAATRISNATASQPAVGRQDIARLAAAPTNAPFTTSQENREAIARALAELGQTRTWGLLIDVIAQTGKYPPNAANLASFVVEGEKRYWLHVAIDRFTGQIVDQQLEAVYE